MRGMLTIRLMLALAGTMAVSQVFAQTLPASVIACADETDVLKRLSCYDREVARYRTPPAAATAPRSPTAASASAAPSAPGAPAVAAPTPSVRAAAAPASAAAGAAIAAAPVSAAATSPAAAAAEFGMNGELKRKEGGGTPEPAKLDKLTARVTSISNRPTGETIYNLEGGQIWVEAETESHLPLHPGEEITIKRGVLGAFYLSSAEARGVRVKRVR
jgi:hypothetical protein